MSAPPPIRTCKCCGETKSLSEFYHWPNAKKPSGLYSRGCKPCENAKTRAARRANLAAYQEADRKRGKRPSLLLNETPEHRQIRRDKQRGRKIMHTAIRKGELIRQPCQVCGAVKVEAHHSDYSKPLDVMWLCRFHHMEEHRRINAIARGETWPVDSARSEPQP